MYSATNNYLFKKHFNHIIVFVTTFSNTNWYDIGETLVNTKYFKVQVCVYVYILKIFLLFKITKIANSSVHNIVL